LALFPFIWGKGPKNAVKEGTFPLKLGFKEKVGLLKFSPGFGALTKFLSALLGKGLPGNKSWDFLLFGGALNFWIEGPLVGKVGPYSGFKEGLFKQVLTFST